MYHLLRFCLKKWNNVNTTYLITNLFLITKHMKKFFFFAIATLGMMVGCQKQEINNVQDPIDDSDRVAVQFSIDAPSLTITKTKGIGAVEEWNQQNLYILGFERAATSYATDAATTLIPNVVAKAPASDLEGEINVVHPNGDMNGDKSIAGEPYYYTDGKVYDFYGYYVDDANTIDNTETTYDGATASIALKIDGTQDVMAAKADPGLDVVAGVAERNAYSSYAARRGVHPTLTFEHMLTRFNFHAVAGAESGTKVTVESVTLDSYTDVTLTVAPTPALTVNAGAIKSALTLGGVASAVPYPQTPAADFTYTYNYETLLSTGDAKIGSSIMAVAGETQHSVVLTTKLTNSNQSIPALTIPLNASDIVTADGTPVEKFEAGYQYDIILTVYGPEEVKITAILSEWKEGGNTIVDPDKWMEEPTEVSAYVSAATETSLTYTIETPNDYVEGQATLYNAAGAAVETKEFVPTKAKTADVTFENLTAGAQYSLEVKVATTADADYSAIKPVEVAPVAPGKIVVTDAFYVCDKDSYNRLPESYRSKTGRSWGEYLAAYKIYESDPESHPDFTPLPWLAVTILPLEYDATLTVDEMNVNFNHLAGNTLFTIAASEIEDFDGFVAGETYTVKITSNDASVSVDITVPEVEEPVVEPIVKKSYVVVETEESYNQLPAAYRAAKGEWAKYQADLEASKEDPESEFHALPWLAVETTPNASATFVVSNGETHKTFNWTLGEIGLATFSADEVGVALEGDWTVTVTIGEITQTVELTVPAPAAE